MIKLGRGLGAAATDMRCPSAQHVWHNPRGEAWHFTVGEAKAVAARCPPIEAQYLAVWQGARAAAKVSERRTQAC